MSASNPAVVPYLYFAAGILFFLLGLTILRSGRSSAATRATAMMLSFAGLGPLLTATGFVLESNPRAGSVVYGNMLETFAYVWEFFFPALLLFALSFPRENNVVRRYPVLALLLFLPYIFHVAVMMYGDRLFDLIEYMARAFPADGEVMVGNRDVDVGDLDNVIGALGRLLGRVHRNLFEVVNIIYSAIALVLLVRNRRDLVNPRVAQQMRTVTWGIAAGVACYAFTKVLSMAGPSIVPHDATLAMINVSLIVSGGTIAWAVVRQQFLGIRNVLRRSLIYTAIAGIFVLLYLVIVRPISEFFDQYSAVSREAFESVFIILAVIAFQPALSRTEEVLSQMFFRGHVGAARRMRRLGDALAAVTTTEELEEVLARATREQLDTANAVLVLEGDDPGPGPLAVLLEEIGEPVRRADLQRLREVSGPRRKRGVLGRFFRGVRRQPEFDETLRAALGEVAGMLDDGRGAGRFEVMVPLFRGQTCVGYLGLGEKIYGVPYSGEDLTYLALLSSQVGTALRNIELLRENLERKLLEEELKIARKIQTQLLPGEPPAIDGFDLCAVTVPSRYVGGDYYDFVVVEKRWLVLVVADVSGKGIPASILTATLQATVRSNADAQTQPDQMMSRLNRLLYRNTSAAEFATLFYAVVDLETGQVRYANAGHDFPFLSSAGRAHQLEHSGIVLGCMDEFAYQASECQMDRDSTLVVYTDGVTESESSDGEYYGTKRLQSIIERHASSSARDLCRAVVDEVRDFGESEGQDDITLLVLKRCA